jgi:hypothetical protein
VDFYRRASELNAEKTIVNHVVESSKMQHLMKMCALVPIQDIFVCLVGERATDE